MNIQDVSPKQLRRAAQIKDRIASLQNELSKLFGTVKIWNSRAPVRKRRKMSKAARAKIAAAAKARWAKVRAGRK